MKHYFKYLAMITAAFMFVSCNDGDDEPNDGEEDTPGTTTPDWHLEWTDNFDTAEFDPTVWHKCTRATSDWNNNMSHADECYGWSNEDGVTAIVLRGIVTPDNVEDDQPYIVGGIETSNLKSFVPPFRIHIRAKLTAANGAWPALWMMPYAAQLGWPYCGEIDIMERLNHDNMVYQTVHYGDPSAKQHYSSGGTAMIAGDDWNIYTIQVSKSAVVWKINGKETYRYTKNANAADWAFPFNQLWHLKMDMQLGGSWVGAVDTTQLPVEMLIDYVKYERYY